MGGYRAKKRLGQNFLVSAEAVEKIIRGIAPQPSETIIEVGAGRGALTLPLAESGARIIAVEYDQDLIGYLTALLRGKHNVEIVHVDFLEYDPSALDRFVLVGNLPYNISSPVLSWACRYHKQIDRSVLMMQKEVALRLSSAPGSKGWSPLSLFTQLYFETEVLFHVQRDQFHPRPDVTSTVIRLTPAEPPAIENFDFFERVVRGAFAQRRKLLVNNLAGEFAVSSHDIKQSLEPLNISVTARAEELSTVQFIGLASAMHTAGIGVGA